MLGSAGSCMSIAGRLELDLVGSSACLRLLGLSFGGVLLGSGSLPLSFTALVCGAVLICVPCTSSSSCSAASDSLSEDSDSSDSSEPSELSEESASAPACCASAALVVASALSAFLTSLESSDSDSDSESLSSDSSLDDVSFAVSFATCSPVSFHALSTESLNDSAGGFFCTLATSLAYCFQAGSGEESPGASSLLMGADFAFGSLAFVPAAGCFSGSSVSSDIGSLSEDSWSELLSSDDVLGDLICSLASAAFAPWAFSDASFCLRFSDGSASTGNGAGCGVGTLDLAGVVLA
mmetsp:Transcript_28203/g.53346  ORF Transcript_28203/g.53346 Transcript_28203/m.53346 type:complete len:294 (-) Transcript_28203:243-1124(-)